MQIFRVGSIDLISSFPGGKSKELPQATGGIRPHTAKSRTASDDDVRLCPVGSAFGPAAGGRENEREKTVYFTVMMLSSHMEGAS